MSNMNEFEKQHPYFWLILGCQATDTFDPLARPTQYIELV